jgi:hypothetical protein
MEIFKVDVWSEFTSSMKTLAGYEVFCSAVPATKTLKRSRTGEVVLFGIKRSGVPRSWSMDKTAGSKPKAFTKKSVVSRSTPELFVSVPLKITIFPGEAFWAGFEIVNEIASPNAADANPVMHRTPVRIKAKAPRGIIKPTMTLKAWTPQPT